MSGGGGIDGDRLVGLIGIVLALVLVSRSGALRSLGSRRRVGYAVIWAIILGVVAAMAERLTG